MRTSIASVALIRRHVGGQTLWLAQWNAHWHRYYFVGGHKHEDESFRECLVREVAEETGLTEHVDYDVVDGPVAHVEYADWSGRAQAQTAYTMELFELRLRSERASRRLDANPKNRWLRESEIRAGRCADGKRVSQTMGLLLQRAGLWNGEGQEDRTSGRADVPGDSAW